MKESKRDKIFRPSPIKAQFKAPNFEIVTNTKTWPSAPVKPNNTNINPPNKYRKIIL